MIQVCTLLQIRDSSRFWCVTPHTTFSELDKVRVVVHVSDELVSFSIRKVNNLRKWSAWRHCKECTP